MIAPACKSTRSRRRGRRARSTRYLIWQPRGISTLFGRDGVRGLVNVDVTPETAARLAMAYGTTLARGARVVASRDAHPASRMIKRAMIAGTGRHRRDVSDLRVAMPASTATSSRSTSAGRRRARPHLPDDPEMIRIRFFEAPGMLVSEATLKSIERAYSRQEFRRVSAAEIGRLSYPSRATEIYAQDLLGTLDVEAIRARGLRMVLNYSYSPASLVVPSMIGELGVELIGIDAFIDATSDAAHVTREESIAEMSRLVVAVGADLGVVMDVAAERIWLVDERGSAVDGETTLLLLLRELSTQVATGSLLVPITETGGVELVVNGSNGRVERTKSSLHALLSAATESGRAVRGASGGGYAFPAFLPAYDALASTGKVLEISPGRASRSRS